MVDLLSQYENPKQFLLRNTSYRIIMNMNIGSPSEVSFTCKLTEKFSEENYCDLKTKLLLEQDSGGHIINLCTLCNFQFLRDHMPTFSKLCQDAFVEKMTPKTTMSNLKSIFWM